MLSVFLTTRGIFVRHSDLDAVRALPLFCSMSEDNFSKLATAAVLQEFPQHMELITEGTLPHFLHIVIQGSVEMFCTHDGHETTIDILRPMTAFVLAAVIRDDIYLSSARALTFTQTISIPALSVRDAFNNDFPFARAIATELAERYSGTVRSLKNEKLRTCAKRLANWILHADAAQGNQRVIVLAFGKRTLAASLGMTPKNSITKPGATIEIRCEDFGARYRHRRFFCAGTFRKT